MQHTNFLSVSLIGFFLLGLTGCSDPDSKYAKVGGTITYNGEPVEGATVTFQSTAAGGESASGSTDAAGKYSVTSVYAVQGGAGVLPGDYTVTIAKRSRPVDPDEEAHRKGEITYDELQQRKAARPPMASGAGRSEHLLPRKYTVASESGLKATVQQGKNPSFDFDLTD